MIEDLDGIVISEKNYSETSKIINVFTKEHGIIGILAKGAKSIKSPLRSVTTKLTYGTFTVYYKNDKLSTLKEVSIINNLNNIKKNINSISFASYLVDLACQVYKENSSKDIYNILISGLIKINDGFDPFVITNIIELKYLEYLGVLPVIDRCAVCGSQDNIVTLSSDNGGYLCSKCHKDEPLISDKSIKLIRMYYYVDIDKIDKLEIKDQHKFEVNNFLNLYYERYTGLYLKSKSFLNSIIGC